jgi:hypothetical protein
MIHPNLMNPEKILLSILHIKLSLMKQFRKTLTQNASEYYTSFIRRLIVTQVGWGTTNECHSKYVLQNECNILFFCSTLSELTECDNLSKRNVKLILKILSDVPLRGSSNKKTLYSTRSCVNWTFFGTRFTRVLIWPTHTKKSSIYTRTRTLVALI